MTLKGQILSEFGISRDLAILEGSNG